MRLTTSPILISPFSGFVSGFITFSYSVLSQILNSLIHFSKEFCFTRGVRVFQRFFGIIVYLNIDYYIFINFSFVDFNMNYCCLVLHIF